MPSTGPQVSGGLGTVNSSRHLTVGFVVVTPMTQPNSWFGFNGTVFVGLKSTRPSAVRPNTPNADCSTRTVGSAGGAGAAYAGSSVRAAGSGVFGCSHA